MKTNIYDRRNAVVGWTIEDAHTVKIYDRTGRPLGWYQKQSKTTHNNHGYYGRGNQVLRLLK